MVVPFAAASLLFFDDVVHSDTLLTNNILSNRLSDLLVKHILVTLPQEVLFDIFYNIVISIVIQIFITYLFEGINAFLLEGVPILLPSICPLVFKV